MRGTRSCRCEAPVRRCVGFFESAEAAAPEVPPKPSAAGSAERGGPTSYHRVCRTGTPDYGTGRGRGGSALRGSSASGAGASIARGCPPRTSPPPAADLRAEARTHLPRHKVRFAQNAMREWAFLAPLSCSSAPNGIRFAGLPFERKPEKKRRSVQRKKTENGT